MTGSIYAHECWQMLGNRATRSIIVNPAIRPPIFLMSLILNFFQSYRLVEHILFQHKPNLNSTDVFRENIMPEFASTG